MNLPHVIVVVSGQLRNATDNLPNWINNIFHNCNPHFVFELWDDIGHVDPAKIHHRCLRKTALWGTEYIELSEVDIYLKLDRKLEFEVKWIEDHYPSSLIRVNGYDESFLTEIDGVTMPPSLMIKEAPWWRGWLPVSYLNYRSVELIKRVSADLDGQGTQIVYCRLQSEVIFPEKIEIDWMNFCNRRNLVLTSPNTIDPESQLSIKFFAASCAPFMTLMEAFVRLPSAFKAYDSGDETVVPIGERFLKSISQAEGLEVLYQVRTHLNRERMIPVKPCLVRSDGISSGEKRLVLDIPQKAYRRCLSAETPLRSRSVLRSRARRLINTVQQAF